jgi:hypothetical protein
VGIFVIPFASTVKLLLRVTTKTEATKYKAYKLQLGARLWLQNHYVQIWEYKLEDAELITLCCRDRY